MKKLQLHRQSQHGFSIITAVFLLVVLSFLGIAMVSFSTMQNQTLAMDVSGTRCYQAANAGIEWAAYNIAKTPNVAGATTFTPGTASALGGVLAPYTVTVSYTATAQTDDTTYPPDGIAETIWSYDITASAVRGTAGTVDYVERVVRAKM